jgi:hypothetical protein
MVVLLAAALLATLFAALFANPAEAKKRHHHHHKKKQQVQVTNITNNTPVQLPSLIGPLAPGLTLVSAPDATDDVVIKGVEFLNKDGKVIGDTVPVDVTVLKDGTEKTLTLPTDLDVSKLVNARKLRLVDADGNRISVLSGDDPPVEVGDIKLSPVVL